MTLLDIPTRTSTVEHALNEARSRIQVTPEELAEARQRRDALAAALKREFGGRTYVNGSIAHGDALNPLTDVDLGIVIPDPDGLYGPGLRGPGALQERAADAIRRELKDEYPKLRVEHLNRRRSILVRFGDPVTPGQADFTADVITAIDNRTGAGLYIPNYRTWDRSHPERHTEMVKKANAISRSTFARGTRLMKHWNRKHDRPICSWNIKALALGCITGPVTMTDYISTWLNHAIEQLSIGETPDPAGVAGPIKINEKFVHPTPGRRRVPAGEGRLRPCTPVRARGLPDPRAQPARDLLRRRDRDAQARSGRSEARLTRTLAREEPVAPALARRHRVHVGLWGSPPRALVGVLMPDPAWYGADAAWFVPFERDAFRLFGRRLRVEYAWEVLRHANPCAVALSCGSWIGVGFGSPRVEAVPRRRYHLDGVDVVGRVERVPVIIEFRPQRYFPGGGVRDGRDFPVVYAGEMQDSPHRYEDGALCLYYPDDPAEQRWTADKNLAELIVLVQDHLFLEDTYAETGEWLAPQAEHGFTEEAKRAA